MATRTPSFTTASANRVQLTGPADADCRVALDRGCEDVAAVGVIELESEDQIDALFASL